MPIIPSHVVENAHWPYASHISTEPLPFMPVGTVLADSTQTAILRVEGFLTLPMTPHAVRVPLVRALQACAVENTTASPIMMTATREGYALAWITLSDKGSRGERIDTSGPQIFESLQGNLPLCHSQGFILPDEKHSLQALVLDLAHMQGYDLIITSGGTGLSSRDVSPEAILPLLDRRLEGLETAMMLASLSKTPHAALSRAVAGTIGTSLIITLPGSRKAVVENLAAALPALQHGLDKLHDDPTDCGR